MDTSNIWALLLLLLLYLLPAIIWIIIIVVIVKKIIRKRKQDAAKREEYDRRAAEYEKRKAAEDAIRKKLEAERMAEEEKRKAEEEKRKEEEEERLIEHWSSTYRKSPYVQKLAQSMAYEFIYAIQHISYDIHNKEVSVHIVRNAYYEVLQSRSERMFVANDLQIDGFDFYKENVSQYEFKNEFQIQGFMKAVAIVAEEIVKREYVAKHPLDVNGQKYKIWSGGRYPYGQWSDPDNQYDEEDRKKGYGWWNYRYSIHLSYTATNPYYQAPKSLI